MSDKASEKKETKKPARRRNRKGRGRKTDKPVGADTKTAQPVVDESDDAESITPATSPCVWVGNVSSELTDRDVRREFERFGQVSSIRMFPRSRCAFVTFKSAKAAEKSRQLEGKQLGSMFLTLNLGMPCRHLWVGNIEPSVSEFALKSEFEAYGQVESVRVLRANQCAFINFYREEDASQACEGLNGKKLGTKGLVINYQWGDVIKRTSRARRALDSTLPSETLRGEFTQPSRQLFVGNIVPSVTEQTLRNLFSRFGQIEQIKGFTTRGYAFVIFKKIQVSIFVRDFMTREPPELGGRALVVNFGRPAHTDVFAHGTPMPFLPPQMPMMPPQGFMPTPTQETVPFMHQNQGMGMNLMPLHTQMQGLTLYDSFQPGHQPGPPTPRGHLPAHLLSPPSTPTNASNLAMQNAMHPMMSQARREQDLAKRERDIAEREKKLVQREIDMSNSGSGYKQGGAPELASHESTM